MKESFGHGPVGIDQVNEPQLHDLDRNSSLKNKLNLKAGYHDGQDMDMYNKSKMKPPLPTSTPDYNAPRNKWKPGNHQSPSNQNRNHINYDNRNIVLEGSNNHEMEFDESDQEDNGNVDMDADDSGPTKKVQTPPSKKWSIKNKTEQTNISPSEWKDRVDSMKSPSWNQQSQEDFKLQQISQPSIVQGSQVSSKM